MSTCKTCKNFLNDNEINFLDYCYFCNPFRKNFSEQNINGEKWEISFSKKRIRKLQEKYGKDIDLSISN